MIMRQRRWPIHLALIAVCFVMLVPFYWVLKTSVSGENIFSYPPNIIPRDPHPFYYVDVWYAISFARYFLNSVVVSALTIVANVVLNAMAGYSLTQVFPGKQFVLMLFLSCMMIPFQATIIPAYLITGKLGLLEFLSRPRVADVLHHHLHFRVQGEFRRGATFADRCRAR